MSNQDKMLEVLKAAVGFSSAEVSVNGPQLRVLARVQKENARRWLDLAKKLKILERASPWTMDLSKMYFLLGDDDEAQLVYGWRMILKSEDLEEACKSIMHRAKSTKKRRAQVTEMALPGGARNRNSYGHGKGASGTSSEKDSGPAMEYFRRT